jgi:hypothetical protein
MDENKRNASIDYILSRGLVKPQGAAALTREMLRTLGLRFIFWDTAYSLVFAALTLVPLVVLLILAPQTYRFTATFAIAPSLFLLITAFAETAERSGELYELKQTCRYTVRQITALRVGSYSLAGIVYCSAIVFTSAENAAEIIRLLSLCLASLFVSAAASLTVMRRQRGRWAGIGFAAFWLLLNLTMPVRLGESWEAFLVQTPTAISLSITAIGAAALIYQLQKMLTEVKIYAIA